MTEDYGTWNEPGHGPTIWWAAAGCPGRCQTGAPIPSHLMVCSDTSQDVLLAIQFCHEATLTLEPKALFGKK